MQVRIDHCHNCLIIIQFSYHNRNLHLSCPYSSFLSPVTGYYLIPISIGIRPYKKWHKHSFFLNTLHQLA